MSIRNSSRPLKRIKIGFNDGVSVRAYKIARKRGGMEPVKTEFIFRSNSSSFWEYIGNDLPLVAPSRAALRPRYSSSSWLLLSLSLPLSFTGKLIKEKPLVARRFTVRKATKTEAVVRRLAVTGSSIFSSHPFFR